MAAKLFLKCPRCGAEADLPMDGSIRLHGVLAMPLHRFSSTGKFEPIESFSDPECCLGSEKLANIHYAGDGVPGFSPGDEVRICRVIDSITSQEIVGHLGHVEEVEPLCNGEFNYDMKCDTCGGTHYVNEPMLEKSVTNPNKDCSESQV